MIQFAKASEKRRQRISDLYTDIKHAKDTLDVIKGIAAAETATVASTVTAAEQEVNAAFDAADAILAEQRRTALATIRRESNIQKLEDALAELTRISQERDGIEPKLAATAADIQKVRTADVLLESAGPEKAIEAVYAATAGALNNLWEVKKPVVCDTKTLELGREALKKFAQKYATVTFGKVYSQDDVLRFMDIDDGICGGDDDGIANKAGFEWSNAPVWISKMVKECPNAFYCLKYTKMEKDCAECSTVAVAITKDTSYVTNVLEKDTSYTFKLSAIVKSTSKDEDLTAISSKSWTLWESNEVMYSTTRYSGSWTTTPPSTMHYTIADSTISSRKNVVARRNSTHSGDQYAIAADTPLTPGLVNRFGIRLIKHEHRRSAYVGVAPANANFACEDLAEKAGYFMNLNSRELHSGPPFNYSGKQCYSRSVFVTENEVVGVIVDLASTVPTISFVIDGHVLGVAYSGFPTDVPLVPTVVTKVEGDEFELLPNDEMYIRQLPTNYDGDLVFLGMKDDVCGGVFYCGLKKNQCRCGGCDGTCGPNNGCACNACDSFFDDFMKAAVAGGHLKCPSGHDLVKEVVGSETLKDGYDGGFICNVCRKTVSRDGRIFAHCDECDYDLCSNCIAKSVPKELFKKGAFPVTQKSDEKK